MGVFKRLFGLEPSKRRTIIGSSEPEPVTRSAFNGAPLPSTTGTIRYDPQLITRLKGDHQQLIRIFTEISNSYKASDGRRLVDALNEFRFALQNHLVVENVKFYAYVQQLVANDQESADYTVGMRREMGGIAQTVLRFLNKYSNDAALAFRSSDFLTELEAIGAALVKRIDAEERQLYTLYTPS